MREYTRMTSSLFEQEFDDRITNDTCNYEICSDVGVADVIIEDNPGDEKSNEHNNKSIIIHFIKNKCIE